MYVTMETQDLRWLAGLLEGEGSFCAGPPNRPNNPRIELAMTDRDVLDRVASLFQVQYIGERHRTYRGKVLKPLYTISLRGKRSVSLMYRLAS